MKILYSWIKDFVDIDLSVEEMKDKLTLAGLEVEAVEVVSIPEGVVAARVDRVENHPNADSLRVCSVDAGGEESLTVVCGAPNVRKGMISALATVGTKLSPEFKVKKAKLRGVKSYGMLCAEDELGLSDDHAGIIDLPEGIEPGTSLDKYFTDDAVFDLDITPDRGDCFSMKGVAREVAALCSSGMKDPSLTPQESEDPVEDYISVSVESPKRCIRYLGRMVRGVTIGESPAWMKQRLKAVGIRSINNVVDVTNYILFMYGQPMHAFDYSEIQGKRIVVREADDIKKFTTLDGVERELVPSDLLICDAQGPTALAGIMGGEDSEIKQDTKDVFLECACFGPVSVRKTAKRLNITTDSSHRFERGVDPESGLVEAIDTAARLISDTSGGETLKGMIDEYPEPLNSTLINLRPEKVNSILGTSIPTERMVSLLESINIIKTEGDENGMVFSAPPYRYDLSIEEDLIEEVGRLYGYDNIDIPESTEIHFSGISDFNQDKVKNRLRGYLSSRGLCEAVTNSIVSEEKNRITAPGREPVRITNPLNPAMECMRTSMLPSLLDAAALNLNRGNKDIRLFECGRAYYENRDNNRLPAESERLAILLEGAVAPEWWNSKQIPVDFYVLKSFTQGIASLVSEKKGFKYSLIEDSDMPFSNEAASFEGGSVKGVMGRIKGEVLKKFQIKSVIYYAEIDITELTHKGFPEVRYKELPRYPSMERDLCFIVPQEVLTEELTAEFYKVSDLVREVNLYDVYKGDKIESGRKSMTFSLSLQAPDRTLKDSDAEKVCNKIIKKAEKEFGARLPG